MFNAILAALIVSLISVVGLIFFIRKDIIESKYGGMLVSASAGIMLATAILDLLPEAIEANGETPVFWALLMGICTFFIAERLIHWYHHHSHDHIHEHDKEYIKPTGYLILFGDGLHNFFDGLAIATAFSVSDTVGIATTIAIILHEVPQELSDFVALMHSGYDKWKGLFFNLLSGLTAIIGVFVGWYFINNVNGSLPYLLAFNAGMFIYISCSDLIPALHEDYKKDKKWLQTIAFLVGVFLMAILINSMHEGHEESNREINIERPVSTSHLES